MIPQGIDMAVPLHENAGAQSIREVQMSILNANLTVLRFGGLALFGASRLSTPKRRIVTFLGGILMAYIPWIIGLTRRREVLQMAEITGHDRRFLAACCMEMWEWLDVEGVTDEALHRNVTGVTLTALRMIVDVAGFVDAMIAVGWIKQGPSCDHFIFPAVKEHVLSSSKERSSNAERQARFREKQKNRNAKSVTSGVTSNVTSNGIRGEERRIKKSKGETPIPLEVPPSLQSQSFLKTWEEWQAHRKEIRKPLRPTSAGKTLAKLAEWGPERSIAAINHSIEKGWQGIFEPHENGAAKVAHDNKIPEEWTREEE